MSRKSQMEILGLAIVFILIIMGFLLYLKFSTGSERTTKEEYLLPAKAQSILTAMLRTDVLCCSDIDCTQNVSYSISDLLKDGADITLRDIQCWNFDEGGYNESQEYAKEQMDILLNKTMGIWDEDYYYEATVKDSPIIMGSSNGKCREQRDSGFHAIELRTDTLEITFNICT